ncbi:MAG: hypothetical protein R3314_06680 [Longimicrobiales bacterium]|nr:hypothetical protein [Longimicrobiales bacterium]
MLDHRTTRRLPHCALVVLVAVALACQDGDTTGLEPGPTVPDRTAGHVSAERHDAGPVPYRGTLLTTEQTPDPDRPDGCELFMHTAQVGESTHLGRYTGTGTTCSYNVQLGVVDPPINPGGGPPPYFVTDFTILQTHTAANGDELEVSGVGLFVLSMETGAAGFVGEGAIEGGTGRFEGATGAFTIRGVTGTPAHYDGWIRFDGSGQP